MEYRSLHSPLISRCIFLLFDAIVGKSWHDKVKDVREKMTKKKADALVVTALDEIACKDKKHCTIFCDLLTSFCHLL